MVGIESTLKALDLVEVIIEQLEKAMEDGTVGLRDLPYLIPVLPKLNDAAKALPQIKAELADLSSDEIITLAQRVITILLGVLPAMAVPMAVKDDGKE